jgi:hypothetical protein
MRVMKPAPPEVDRELEATCMGETERFQEALRRLAMIDKAFIKDRAGLGLGLAGISALDPKTAALLQVGASVAMGSSGVCTG